MKELENGLTVGYVTGKLGDITEQDLRKRFTREVDILISYQWPKLIADEERLTTVGDPKLDFLLEAVKPRYWFAIGYDKGKFFERAPFKWNDEGHGERITRFISLAEQGSKEKWYYAFNISKNASDDVKSVTGLGSKPVPRKRTPESLPEVPKKRTKEGPLERKRPRVQVSPESCFFCLSNPKVELHMIISIGEYSYLTVAKGPLTVRNSPFGFSGHGLIIPINHYPTLLRWKEGEEAKKLEVSGTKESDGSPTTTVLNVQDTEVYKEIQHYKSSLLKMFKSFGDYGLVFWEISRSDGVHFHTQFVPIPLRAAKDFEKYLIKQIDFEKSRYGDELSYVRYSQDDKKEIYEAINSQDYMLITLAKSEEEQTNYLFRFTEASGRADLQFPRKVVAFLLNLGRRIQWAKCQESLADETEQRDSFQKKFQPYDFTLEN
ncbi:DEKNAAC102303 [Brettanomyces naardenensis]|uniref:DEKNAAC102303 n=1 Tax=Brettanomyces naardenensis TaxID=13370 RepID=A0A448YKV8_BRENA|nr:DEKNAAC102303 [Brettanomyces naardenensis]